jgi:hypothetical protein
VIAHLLRYAEPHLAVGLRARNRIDGDDYDWSINAWPRGTAPR